jgi:CBS-domain-containing membrane protein
MTKMSKVVKLPFPPKQIAVDMMEREDAIHIAYEKGLAFPHARYQTLSDLDVAIAVLKHPVKLKDNDRDESRMIVCSLISETTSVIYLKILAAFTKLVLSNSEALSSLASVGSAKEFIAYLNERKVEVKHTLCAEDVMLKEVKTLHEDDPISAALDIIAIDKYAEIPVVDAERRLVGVLSPAMIFRRAVPDYIMMLDNLNFLTQFEPFETLLKEEQNTLVRDLMKPTSSIVKMDTPLIQLTLKLLKDKESALYVIDNGKLAGAITFIDLVTNVLRG